MRAGLWLYALTAVLLDAVLQPKDRQIIALTVARINESRLDAGERTPVPHPAPGATAASGVSQ